MYDTSCKWTQVQMGRWPNIERLPVFLLKQKLFKVNTSFFKNSQKFPKKLNATLEATG